MQNRFREFHFQEGGVYVVVTHAEGLEESSELLQSDPLCVHGCLDGLDAAMLGKLGGARIKNGKGERGWTIIILVASTTF